MADALNELDFSFLHITNKESWSGEYSLLGLTSGGSNF